jgi:hypothetical protein
VPGEDSLHGNGEQPVEDLEIEDDDDIRDDTAGLFGIDLGDGSNPMDVDAGDGDGVAASTDTNAASSGGKKSAVCKDFTEIKENYIRIAAICKLCGKRYSARSTCGTGHLIRHQKTCRAKHDNDRRVQSRIALNVDSLHN